MILSGHQPVYLPGIILFNKIALSDAFMFVGHCQYVAKSWHSHNEIRTGRLTVPVHKNFGQSIDETKIVNNGWKRKHLRAIELTYSKRPFFKEYFSEIELLINSEFQLLGDMNIALIVFFLRALKIETPVYIGGSYKIEGQKTDMLISMCKALNASEYLSNEGARSYVDEAAMKEAEITHRWQKFTHPVYEQGHKEFKPNLSVIDLLFNCGPESAEIIRRSGHVE